MNLKKAGLIGLGGLGGLAGVYMLVAQGLENIQNWEHGNSTEFSGPVSTFAKPDIDENYSPNGNDQMGRYIRGEIAHQGEYPSFMTVDDKGPEAPKL